LDFGKERNDTFVEIFYSLDQYSLLEEYRRKKEEEERIRTKNKKKRATFFLPWLWILPLAAGLVPPW
jgi:hypothetical protein